MANKNTFPDWQEGLSNSDSDQWKKFRGEEMQGAELLYANILMEESGENPSDEEIFAIRKLLIKGLLNELNIFETVAQNGCVKSMDGYIATMDTLNDLFFEFQLFFRELSYTPESGLLKLENIVNNNKR